MFSQLNSLKRLDKGLAHITIKAQKEKKKLKTTKQLYIFVCKKF